MNCSILEKICESKKICIWGFGKYGRTFVYISLKCAGANIYCYCDNRYEKYKSSKSVPLISKEELFDYRDKVFVFVAVKDIQAQREIIEELKKHNISAAVFDAQTLTELCNSIEQSDDIALREKYKDLMDDELYLKAIFQQQMDSELDLNEPKTFNEKLNWLKIYDRNPLYTKLVDKSEVKKYVSEIIEKKYIIPTLGVFDSFDEINFDELPDKFVLKCTRDSGSVIICKDKAAFNINKARKMINRALMTNYYWVGREWPYKMVNPRVICEELLVDESGKELKDYKVFCFNGVPRFIQVDFNRFTNHKRNIYSIQWEYIGFTSQYPTDPSVIIEKPTVIKEMLDISSVLSKDLKHVRIDFYVAKEKLYIGEMTFYHESGFGRYYPEEWDYRLGDYLKL